MQGFVNYFINRISGVDTTAANVHDLYSLAKLKDEELKEWVHADKVYNYPECRD